LHNTRYISKNASLMPPGIFCGLQSAGIAPLIEPELQLLDLPDELLGVITGFLAHWDMCNLAIVCKRFRHVVGEDSRWYEWHDTLFGDIPARGLWMTSYSLLWSDSLRQWQEGNPKKFTLQGHTSYVMGLQFDEDKIVSCGGVGDQTVKIWPIVHGSSLDNILCSNTLHGHVAAVIKV